MNITDLLDDEPTNIISLSEARQRYEFGKCQHKRVTVDEILAEVECRDCGVKLNLMQVLVRLAREESILKNRIEAMRQLKADLEKKQRTKCRHCGQMTPVHPSR